MTRLRRNLGIALLSSFLVPLTGAMAQGDCLNETQYPSGTITPNPLGQVTTISAGSFESEYSHITGILSGAEYVFTLASGGYITVREGSFDGPVLGQGGGGSVQVLTTSSLDLFPHWNTDDQCGLASNGTLTTVQLLLNCTPPTVSYTFTEDCDAQTYSVLLNITSLGDAASVDVAVDVNGNITTSEDLGVGEYELGPFGLVETPTITVQHDTDPLCNIVLADLGFETNCPLLVTCGEQAIQQTYCYEPNDSRSWLYTSVGSGTLRMTFLRGTIESNFYDSLRIYDGVDNTAPLLFSHDTTTNYNLGPVGSAINNNFNRYYAIDVFATGNSLYMEMGSDGSVQCGGEFPSENYDAWEWEVVCLDCELPQASYTVVDDCVNQQFSIPIEVTSTGDGSIVNIIYIVNGGDPQTVINVGVGIAELGPFALNDTVNVTIAHESNGLCNVEFGNITDTGECPLEIECGTEVSDVNCYGNSVDIRYYYQGLGTFPLAIFFDAGELFFGDSLKIYDGGNISAPVLYQGAGVNVTDLFVNTTNPEHRLTVQIKSNEFTSCEDGFEPEQLEWRVSCLDCVPSTADFNIVQDCANEQYFIDVVISELGTDPDAQIANSFNTDTLVVTATGTYQIGPFPTGTELEVTVVNDANSLCNVYSGNLVNPLCPVLYDCPGPTLVETYCYTANDNRAWAYELVDPGGTSTLRLTFIRGTIESNTFDDLRIYDGPDNSSPILFEHNNAERRHLGPEGSATTDPAPVYYAVDVAATGNNLYMEMSSDGSVQCGSIDYDEWEWEVYCIDCTNPTVLFNVVPDCIHREYTAEVIVTEEGGDDGLTILNTINGDVQSDLGVGVHNFGPYPVDSLSVFRVSNQAFEQCRATSDTLTYTAEECVSVTCGFDNFTYCYENDEDRWYTYESAQNVPMTVAFLQGQMVTGGGDRIVLYNGADETAPVLYQGNNGGDLTGFAVNSANVDNRITLRIQSDATGSCEDGQVTTPLAWTVSCGAVGVTELPEDGFTVHPNPTQGVLQIELGTKVSGPVQVRVLDMRGRIVMELPLQMNGGTRNAIDMRGLRSGSYMVQLTTDRWIKNQRVQLAH